MKALFVGVGEACDERLPNTSVLVRSEAGGQAVSALLDCGFTAAHRYFLYATDPDELDVLWISHFHGDHFFGTPALLLRFWEMGRRKPLLVLGQAGVEEIIRGAMELAYPGFLKKLEFPLECVEIKSGERREALGCIWRCAEGVHGRRNLALRIDDGARSIFYSGDGQPTPETLALAKGCDLVIHEAFTVHEMIGGHNSAAGSVDFALRAGARKLAAVHVRRDIRKERLGEILATLAAAQGLEATLPEPGDVVEI
jgi:ribonuclease BN (tRNA processing enzyme)